jgi:SEL1 protein
VNPLASSTATRALHYHRLAAAQGNVMSLLRIGDAYYYGRGTSVSLVKSVNAYRQASEQRNAHAMFNLAHMHEHGIGMQKDLHLAKRYYDMILTSAPDSAMVVKIALHKLAIHRWIIDHHDAILAFARELKENPTAQMIDFVILVGATALLLFVLGLRVMLV